MKTIRERLIRSLFNDYLEAYTARDRKILELFSESFTGYTSTSDTLITTREEWLELLMKDFAQIQDRIEITVEDLSVQDLSADVVAATAVLHIHLPIADDILIREPYRFILIFRREGQAWKIVYSGASIPYHLAKRLPDEIYPVHELQSRNQELEELVEKRTSALEKALRALEVLSTTDDLTGLANRRAFNRTLRQEWSRAQRVQAPLSLVMVDIDYFKHYNDRYGHQAGDECLKAVAKVVAQSVHRTGELAARYGGEELAALLPNSNEHEAYECARRMQRGLQKLKLLHEGVPAGMVTLSLGIASLTPSTDITPDKLIRRADSALYQAKGAGRNCLRLDRTPVDKVAGKIAQVVPIGRATDPHTHNET